MNPIAKSDQLNVPVELLQLSLQNHCLNDLRLFLMLKINWGGTFRMSKESVIELTSILGYSSTKSTHTHLKNLEKLDWVNFDYKTNLLFIKGFEALRQKLGLKQRTGAIINRDNLINNNQFKGFAAGAVINNMVNSQKIKLRRLGQQKGCSAEDRINNANGYFNVATEGLAKILKCSIGQAFNLKKLAKLLGFIKVKKGLIVTEFNIKEIEGFRLGNPELSPKLTRKKNKIAIKSSDQIKSNMPFSRREKI
ncbi:hypothetical protein [uncultured Mucilaginibacter sp.]|uniref:hypothetical protein n=1 Tax=uncultured Mucilaginibacter sp. TaxID=797541 RepID=UPI0025FD1F54|nr:hypothetical protein [uncultured Mucilaginibacter sp.]